MQCANCVEADMITERHFDYFAYQSAAFRLRDRIDHAILSLLVAKTARRPVPHLPEAFCLKLCSHRTIVQYGVFLLLGFSR